MSGKSKQRLAANSLEAATIPVNERILRECHSLYTDPSAALQEAWTSKNTGFSCMPQNFCGPDGPELNLVYPELCTNMLNTSATSSGLNFASDLDVSDPHFSSSRAENPYQRMPGLIDIGNGLNLKLLPPRKKLLIMLMGNHSAGKSSFINWYVEEHIQKTGVAIETQGFTMVTSGRKRETLTGNATLHLYPHFQPLQQIAGVCDYLTTEISTSKQKKFNLVTFVDTPGLVDGDMKYPFDVDEAIFWLGQMCDLIFVFFDPMGQALCKRTLNIVERLNGHQPDKIRFYLSKADEAGTESDRQRVMMQIVQELCKRPGLNRCGFDMPTIYIPNINPKPNRCVNQIEQVCRDIERSITHTVQNTLNQLEADCDKIMTTIDVQLNNDSLNRSHNWQAKGRGLLFLSLGTVIPLMFVLTLLMDMIPVDLLRSLVGAAVAEALLNFAGGFSRIWKNVIPIEYHTAVIGWIVGISAVLIIAAKWNYGGRTTLSRKQKKILVEKRNYVHEVIRSKKRSLYQEYLEQCVTETDL